MSIEAKYKTARRIAQLRIEREISVGLSVAERAERFVFAEKSKASAASATTVIDRSFLSTARRTARRTGLTLIEVTISLILVSTLLLVSITASANLIRQSNRNNTAVTAGELAGIVLDEVAAMHFADPATSTLTFGIESNEDVANRTTFDDVDDYHLYSQSSATYRDGQTIDQFSGWTYQVTVSPAVSTASGIALTTDTNDPLRLVTVSCTSPDGGTADVALTQSESILISQTSDRPTIDQSHEKLRKLKLQFSDGRELSVVAPLINHPTAASN